MQSNIRSSNSRNVDFERHHISYSDIDTDSLSTCIGLLLDGSIGNQAFCFLSHSSKIDEYKDDDLKYLLVRLLAKLAYCLKKDFGMNSSLESYAVNNLKLLIVGGAIDEHILTRKAFSLMNADVELRVIRQITNDDDAIYLFKKLKNSVKSSNPLLDAKGQTPTQVLNTILHGLSDNLKLALPANSFYIEESPS